MAFDKRGNASLQLYSHWNLLLGLPWTCIMTKLFYACITRHKFVQKSYKLKCANAELDNYRQYNMWLDLQKGVFHTHQLGWIWRTITWCSNKISVWNFYHSLHDVSTLFQKSFKSIALHDSSYELLKLIICMCVEDPFSQIWSPVA